MSIVTKVAKMRLNYHATMLDICNVANQLGILKDEKAEEVMKKHTFKCFDAMEHMGLDPYGAMKEEEPWLGLFLFFFFALKTVSLMERLLISKEGLHYDIIYNLINHIGGISNTDSTRRSSVGCCRNCSIRRCDCMCRDYSINYPTLY